MKKKFAVKFTTGMFIFGMAGIANAGIINFDDIDAPSYFTEQTALADEYSLLGVHFSGSGEVLNFGSSFGVDLSTPFTSPNFLAFNFNSNAFPPEAINFDIDIDSFSLDFAGSTGTISLTAYNDGTYVDTVSLSSSTYNSWSTISLALTTSFDMVVFSVANTDNTFVIDNLTYHESSPVPEPTTMLLFGTGLAGLAGNRTRRRKK
jgi:hypothetical protein